MPLLETKGAASAQGFGEFAKVSGPVYIEDVFSTYLYTGNTSTQTITNGIDLSTKGGLVWIKYRTGGVEHNLQDTAQGAGFFLSSNFTTARTATTNRLTAFNSDGFTLGPNGAVNQSGATFVSWTFRKQTKFFDIVTYTGDGSARTIAHNLGSAPGCLIIKETSSADAWYVWHRSLTSNSYYLQLQSTNPQDSGGANLFNNTAPTASVFSVGTDTGTNANGASYVAYLFAHDAGGFGLTGSDNVISCGTYTTDGVGSATISLGYEPQWVLIKNIEDYTNWWLLDNMRGFGVGNSTSWPYIRPDSASAEATSTGLGVTATGFTIANFNALQKHIYIAIRRGPMKVPTDATKVFSPYVTATVAASASGSNSTSALYNPGFVTDTGLQVNKTGVDGWYMGARLTATNYLKTETTAAQVSSASIVWDSNIGAWNNSPGYGLYSFRRAPSYFDVVCYTGTGSNTTQAHNLGVVPELMIVKRRSSVANWIVYSATLGYDKYLLLELSNAEATLSTMWNASPSASNFSVGTRAETNGNGATYVNYLFATCPGVSKVGSYTGTGALQTVNCGFTGGARFVLIKRTDSTGDWWVYDSARGISSGNDPYLFLNVAAAEVTGTNYVDTDTTGFKVTAAAPAGLNANGGTYIFLAIA